jgi:anti-sigma factor RsiW
MKREACDLLDDYLAGDLTEQSLVVFENHWQNCPECREAVQFHEVLTGRLKAAIATEIPPPRLLAEVRSQQATDRRRRWVAVAAMAASIIGVVVVLNRAPRPGALPIENVPTPAKPAAVQVTFPRADVLTVPVPVNEPGITVMWVYPVVRPTVTNQSIERNEQ